MPFPSTFADLGPAGYRYAGHGTCKGCAASIEWWLTPAGKRIPLNLMYNGGRSPVIPHHSTCPNVEQFRKQKAQSR